MYLHCIYSWAVFLSTKSFEILQESAATKFDSMAAIQMQTPYRSKSVVFAALAGGVTDPVHEFDQWHEHRDDDAADDDGKKNDHDRFEERSHGGHRVVNLFVVVVRDLQKHFWQRAGLLADVHHADHHWGEHAGCFQRRGDRFTLLDAFVNLADGVANDHVACSFLHDGQGLQNRDATADE